MSVAGVVGVTVPTVCDDAGISLQVFAAHFGTVEHVFVEIARFMMAAYSAGISDTLVRRRSLFQSIRIAQLTFFDVVQRNWDTPLAFTSPQVAAVDRPALAVPGAPVSSIATMNHQVPGGPNIPCWTASTDSARPIMRMSLFGNQHLIWPTSART